MLFLTYSSVGIAAAPPTSSTEAIHHFLPIARYTLRMEIQWWSVTAHRWWVSGYWCLSSAKSSRMTVLLLGPFCVLLFFCSTQFILLMQKRLLGILYNQPLLASSRSANPCLCTLSSTLHINGPLPLVCSATSLFPGDGQLDDDDFLHQCRPQNHVHS